MRTSSPTPSSPTSIVHPTVTKLQHVHAETAECIMQVQMSGGERSIGSKGAGSNAFHPPNLVRIIQGPSHLPPSRAVLSDSDYMFQASFWQQRPLPPRRDAERPWTPHKSRIFCAVEAVSVHSLACTSSYCQASSCPSLLPASLRASRRRSAHTAWDCHWCTESESSVHDF